MLNNLINKLKHLFAKDHLSERNFDQKYNIQTDGYYGLEDMNVDRAMKEHGHDYQGTPLVIFERILKKIPGDRNQQTFIDFGSGLGRMLFAALEHDFGKIIGVEYGLELYQKSLANIQESKLSDKDRMKIQVINENATTYSLPDTDAVLYFFNPFDEEILAKVIANITNSIQLSPRILYVIYYNPWYRELMDDNKAFRVVEEGGFRGISSEYKFYEYVIYKIESI